MNIDPTEAMPSNPSRVKASCELSLSLCKGRVRNQQAKVQFWLDRCAGESSDVNTYSYRAACAELGELFYREHQAQIAFDLCP